MHPGNFTTRRSVHPGSTRRTRAWAWAIALGLVLGMAARPALATNSVSGALTADNYAVLYTSPDESAPALTLHAQKLNASIGASVAVSVNTTDEYLYIVAWSDDAVAQGLLFNLAVNGVDASSGTEGWLVYPMNVNKDNGTLPSASAIEAAIATASATNAWTRPTVGGPNGGFLSPTWGFIPAVGGGPRWIWYNAGTSTGADTPFRPGHNHAEMLIFRRCLPSHRIQGAVTADNFYALYTANFEGAGMRVTTRGGTPSPDANGICGAESYDFSTDDGYLYVVAWSDDANLQGLLHDLTLDGNSIASGTAGWSVYPAGLDIDTNAPPTAAQLAGVVSGLSPGSWLAPTVGGANGTFLTTFWCSGPVSGISTAALWVWYDSGGGDRSLSPPFRPGFNHGEYLIFRRPLTSHTIAGDAASDNYLALYTADREGLGMTVTLQGSELNAAYNTLVSPSFSTSDRFVYVAAWSDFSIAQGLLHDLSVDGEPWASGGGHWLVYPTGVTQVGAVAPSTATIAAAVQLANASSGWRLPTVGGRNDGTFNSGVWGAVAGIDADSKWTWYDTGGGDRTMVPPFRPGFNHSELLIFRAPLDCAPDSSVLALGPPMGGGSGSGPGPGVPGASLPVMIGANLALLVAGAKLLARRRRRAPLA